MLAFAIALAISAAIPASAAGKAALDKAVTGAAAYVLKTVAKPEVGAIGGEWAVIGLARSGCPAPESYYQDYFNTVTDYVKERKGALHDKKYTEYSRVVLALTAAGYDPRDVAGYDLTAPLADFDKTVWQGVNGPIWALIALDSGGYPNPQRDRYIAEILSRQLNDGGWNLTGGAAAETKGEAADSDVTGMALQALAKYQDRAEVKAATDKALACLSKIQEDDGGFKYGSTGDALESSVQALVALCELGIPADDPRFVKNGSAIIDSILSHAAGDGSFRHTNAAVGSDSQMSTEQALYALAAAQRARDGKNSLYRMSDAPGRGKPLAVGTDGLPGKNADIGKAPVTKPGATFADVAAHPSKTAVEALASREILNGKGDGKFDPNGLVTRAEFAKIVALSLGLPEKTAAAFSDVPAAAWYAKPVATAFSYGIINGVGDNRFNPSGDITRQDAAVMAARAAKLCGMDTARSDAAIRDALAQFGDYTTAASYAKEALAFCYASGIMDDSELDIQPTKPALRWEIAEMLYRLLDKASLL